MEAEIDKSAARKALVVIRARLDDLLNLYSFGERPSKKERPGAGAERMADWEPWHGKEALVNAFFTHEIHPDDEETALKYVKIGRRYFTKRFKLRDAEKIRDVNSRQRRRFDHVTGLMESLDGALGATNKKVIAKWTDEIATSTYKLRLALRVPKFPPDPE